MSSYKKILTLSMYCLSRYHRYHTGLPVEFIVKHVKCTWNDIVKRPLITSIAACVLAASVAIGIDQAGSLSLPDVSIFPPSWCRVMISETDQCSLFGWNVPCHKTFSEESLEHFGL